MEGTSWVATIRPQRPKKAQVRIPEWEAAEEAAYTGEAASRVTMVVVIDFFMMSSCVCVITFLEGLKRLGCVAFLAI
jgi:hypothetical protein